MKIKFIPNNDAKNIKQFADEHHLTMEVRERSVALRHNGRYFASFEKTDVKDGSVLISSYGNGNTPEEAIKNYASQIENKLLVVNAHGPNRKEIWVPKFEGEA
jgi:hypothetical protein